MIKETITYKDFNGVERTEDFFFNFTEQEVIQMELGRNGGIADFIQKIIDSKDQKAIIEYFKQFVLDAYGEKSDDGKYFVKIANDGHRVSNDFAQTQAFSKLYMKLAFDSEAAAKFVNGVIPEKIELPETASQENKIN